MPLAMSLGDAGPAALGGWNRAMLLTTILLFFSLSAISGRVLWRQYAAKRARRAGATEATAANSTPQGSNTALNASSINKPSYATGSGAGAPTGPPPTLVGGSESALMEEEGAASASTGAEMRQRLFLLLFLASTLRVCSLVTEVSTLTAVEPLPATSISSRLLTLFLWLPSMLFVSMYGLVLLFWAQLCYACWGKAYPWPRRVFFAFNVLLYAAFALLFVLSSTSDGLWRGCDLLQGAVYFLGLFGILYYSIRLIYFFRTQSPDEDFFFDLPTTANSGAVGSGNGIANGHKQRPSPALRKASSPRQIVLRRITAVCILLCVLFAVKVVYLLGMGTGYMPSEESQYRTPVGVHHIAYEFAIHFSTEFVPSALLLFFTRRDKKATGRRQRLHSSSTTSASASGGGYGSSNPRDKPPTPNYGYPPVRSSGVNGMSSGPSYQEETLPMLSGYQYQATQRAYGFSSTASMSSTSLRSSNSSGAFLLDSISGNSFGHMGPNVASNATHTGGAYH